MMLCRDFVEKNKLCRDVCDNVSQQVCGGEKDEVM